MESPGFKSVPVIRIGGLIQVCIIVIVPWRLSNASRPRWGRGISNKFIPFFIDGREVASGVFLYFSPRKLDGAPIIAPVMENDTIEMRILFVGWTTRVLE